MKEIETVERIAESNPILFLYVAGAIAVGIAFSILLFFVGKGVLQTIVSDIIGFIIIRISSDYDDMKIHQFLLDEKIAQLIDVGLFQTHIYYVGGKDREGKEGIPNRQFKNMRRRILKNRFLWEGITNVAKN